MNLRNKVISYFENEGAQKYIIFIMYFIINALFLLKYGIRLGTIPIIIATVIFCLVHIFFFRKVNYLIGRIRINKKIINSFIIISGICYLVFSHLINDPYKLNIDRWQTIEYSLDYWLEGRYIYDTRNFMGNVSSYLPGQLLLLLGFRFLGNVGYMQIASLFLFYFAILGEFKKDNIRFLGILLLTFSLSFIYEAVCKSDFISSFIITAAFILFWSKRFEKDYFQKPILLGIILGIIGLTRSVVVIPLILFLLRPFFETSWQNKVKFITTFLIIIGLLLFSILFPAKDFNHILKHNPLKMQGQTNQFVVIFFLALTVFLSFYLKKVKHIFYASSILIFCLMTIHLMEQALRGSAYNFFNITYLAAALPFCIVSFCYILNNENYQND